MIPSSNPAYVASLASAMSRTCANEKLAMTLQYVALGSMIVMALAAAVHLVKDVSGHEKQWHRNGWDR